MQKDHLTKKQIQNRRYYETHPERKIKARERQRKSRDAARQLQSFANVIPLEWLHQKKHGGGEPPKIPPGIAQIRQDAILASREGVSSLRVILAPFVAFASAFLLREMFLFYYEGGQNHFWSAVQAGIGESAVLIFSALRGKSFSEKLAYQALTLAFCVFSVYTVSARQIGSALDGIAHTQASEEVITNLKTAITEKKAERDRYTAQVLIWPARKVQREIDALRLELKFKIEQHASLKSVRVSNQNLVAQLLFRILLILANIFAVRRLTETFGVTYEISGLHYNATEKWPEVSEKNTEISVSRNMALEARRAKTLKLFQGSFSEKIGLKLAKIVSGIQWVFG